MGQDEQQSETTRDDEASTRPGPKKTVRRVVKKTEPAAERRRVTLGRSSRQTSGAEQRSRLGRQQGSQLGRRNQTASSNLTTQPIRKKQAEARQTKPSPIKRSTRAGLTGLSAGTSHLARRTRAATKGATEATQSAYGYLRGVRVPAMPQLLAAAIAGVLTGLFTVVAGWGFTHLFSWLRGTSTGGRTWGMVAIAILLILTLIVGELLLRELGARRSRLTSFTGICVTLALVLGFFLDIISGAWIWLVVPALTAASFVVMHKALELADEYSKD